MNVPDDLLRIQGEFIAEALQFLPDPAHADEGAVIDAFVHIPRLGYVRITTRRVK